MTVKSKSALKSFNDANINTNGVNAITGALHNTMDEDIIDSMVNVVDDALSIVTNVYRSASEAITTAETQITFSTPLANNLYEVVIFDPAGIGFENINDEQTTGFKITGLNNGTIIYFVILTN